ncbi:MAG: AAA domain-containing protein [Candidatus Thorarchaeota archaeon]
MKIINTVFLERNNGDLKLFDLQNQITIQLTLFRPWVFFPFSSVEYYTPIRVINPFLVDEVENVYETTPDTLILLNPDVLINSRAITSAGSCPRRAYIDHILGETKTNLPMVRGSIIHEAYSDIIANYTPAQDAMEIAIERFAFILDILEVNLEELRKDVLRVLRGLELSAPTLQSKTVQPEITFLSPEFGIMGRIDYWSPEEIYELKTGRRIPQRNTWFSDLLQTVIYMHGLSSSSEKAVTKSSVIYSGEGIPAFRQTNLDQTLLQQIHMARNYSYLVQFSGYIPKILGTRVCDRCFSKEECHILGDIFDENASAPSRAFLYLTHWSRLTGLEHTKNRQDFSFLWKLSPQGRVKLGKAISDLQLTKRNKKKNLYLYNGINNSELRPGQLVILSQGNPILDNTMMATIAEISRSKVILNSQGKLPKKAFIDAYSSDFLFRRLNKNLFDITFGIRKDHKSHDLIINAKKPRFGSGTVQEVPGFDKSQSDAIQKALSALDYCLIVGPAGTGKTYTIAKLVEILRRQGQTILLTAYTNTAVDNMIDLYLALVGDDKKQEIVRFGSEHTVSSSTIDLLPQEKGLKFHELLKTPILAGTTSTLSRSLYDDLIVDTVIVDEASQMTEPSVLAGVTKGTRFILVGDDKQLPPLIQNPRADREGLSTSMFERLRKVHPDGVVQLQYQYRMHNALMDFSNRMFYHGTVSPATIQIGNQTLWEILPEDTPAFSSDPVYQTILDPNQPLVYVGIQTNFDKKRRVNPEEAVAAHKIVNAYLKMGIKDEDIGVIAPFRGQVAEITRLVGTESEVVIDTIDRFQGSDKEVIILSLCTLVRPHILEDERRLNVALTRAKRKMIILGGLPHSEKTIPLFQDLFSHIERNYSFILLTSTPPKSEEQDLGRRDDEDSALMLSTDMAYQPLTTDDVIQRVKVPKEEPVCVLCQDPVQDQTLLRCPICNQAYHLEHLQDWLMSQDFCVTCQSHIQLT